MDSDAAMASYYERDKENDRLLSGAGRLEFIRTTELIGRTLPAAPATIADIGGGTGRYSKWLADLGYTVAHRDPIALHVDYTRDLAEPAIDTAVGDARSLDLHDRAVDAVLLLGPLYHLVEAADRMAALSEAFRIVKPGGVVYMAAISRWAARLDGVIVSQTHREYPLLLDYIDTMERTGVMSPIREGGFVGYGHRPQELRDEVTNAGFTVESLVAIEGMAVALADLDERLDDPEERAVLLASQAAVEAVPDLLGIGPHLLVTARRSAS